jgi:hypothetical protein
MDDRDQEEHFVACFGRNVQVYPLKIPYTIDHIKFTGKTEHFLYLIDELLARNIFLDHQLPRLHAHSKTNGI